MHGQVILPENPVMQVYNPKEANKYTQAPPFSITDSWFIFDGRTNYQKVLEIHPSNSSKRLEYLIVMRIGGQGIEAKPVIDSKYAGTEFEVDGKKIKIRFQREGNVGGSINLGGKKPLDHLFVNKVDDSYRHWIGDLRFEKWMKESRFRFLHLRGD